MYYFLLWRFHFFSLNYAPLYLVLRESTLMSYDIPYILGNQLYFPISMTQRVSRAFHLSNKGRMAPASCIRPNFPGMLVCVKRAREESGANQIDSDMQEQKLTNMPRIYSTSFICFTSARDLTWREACSRECSYDRIDTVSVIENQRAVYHNQQSMYC